MKTSKLPSFETAFTSYRATEILGQGGAGKVFKVQSSSGETLAAKTLHRHADTEKRKRFKNEVFFCLKNKHPNIMTVVDYGTTKEEGSNLPFFIMPFYPATLRTQINKGVDCETALRYFLMLLTGVEAAHLEGVWHRDIKPENILIEPRQERLVVSDFGIAHLTKELLQTSVRTRDRARLANFQYAAPEQRTPGRPVDHRADIFALGLILNELFTGEVCQGTGFKKIENVAPQLTYLDDVVDKMIQQEPHRRPANIAEIRNMLIARELEFACQQRIRNLESHVIPKSDIDDPLAVEPPMLTAVDYHNGRLELKLSQGVNSKWEQCFHNIGNYGCLANQEPDKYLFDGNAAYIGTSVHDAQKTVEYFKQHLDSANRDYKTLLEKEAKQQEEKERQKLREQLHDEKLRQRVLSQIKI